VSLWALAHWEWVFALGVIGFWVGMAGVLWRDRHSQGR